MKFKGEISQYLCMLDAAERKKSKTMSAIIQDVNENAITNETIRGRFKKLVEIEALNVVEIEGHSLPKYTLSSKGAELRTHLRKAHEMLNNV